jgi:hypothetical protein
MCSSACSIGSRTSTKQHPVDISFFNSTGEMDWFEIFMVVEGIVLGFLESGITISPHNDLANHF